MIEQSTSNWVKVATLAGRSLCKSKLWQGKLAYGLDDHTVQLFHLNNSKLQTLKTGHTKRLNQIVLRDGFILTCSNDGSARLYDERIFKQVNCFKKNQNEFYSTAMDSGSLVAAGTHGSIVFWDTRNKSNVRTFEESFNEEVTGLEFNKDRLTNLVGCGLDGIVSSFDLSQPNEQESVEWSQRLNNAAQSVSFDNGHLRVHTTDHHLVLLHQGDIIKKHSINCLETPKHLLWSSFTRNELAYYAWNINEQRIQKYIDNNLVLQAKNVPDLDSLEEIESNRALIADEFGNLLMTQMATPEREQEKLIVEQPIQKQQDEEQMDAQGFVKTNYKKSRKPLYKPF